MLLIVVLT